MGGGEGARFPGGSTPKHSITRSDGRVLKVVVRPMIHRPVPDYPLIYAARGTTPYWIRGVGPGGRRGGNTGPRQAVSTLARGRAKVQRARRRGGQALCLQEAGK